MGDLQNEQERKDELTPESLSAVTQGMTPGMQETLEASLQNAHEIAAASHLPADNQVRGLGDKLWVGRTSEQGGLADAPKAQAADVHTPLLDRPGEVSAPKTLDQAAIAREILDLPSDPALDWRVDGDGALTLYLKTAGVEVAVNHLTGLARTANGDIYLAHLNSGREFVREYLRITPSGETTPVLPDGLPSEVRQQFHGPEFSHLVGLAERLGKLESSINSNQRDATFRRLSGLSILFGAFAFAGLILGSKIIVVPALLVAGALLAVAGGRVAYRHFSGRLSEEDDAAGEHEAVRNELYEKTLEWLRARSDRLLNALDPNKPIDIGALLEGAGIHAAAFLGGLRAGGLSNYDVWVLDAGDIVSAVFGMFGKFSGKLYAKNTVKDFPEKHLMRGLAAVGVQDLAGTKLAASSSYAYIAQLMFLLSNAKILFNMRVESKLTREQASPKELAGWPEWAAVKVTARHTKTGKVYTFFARADFQATGAGPARKPFTPDSESREFVNAQYEAAGTTTNHQQGAPLVQEVTQAVRRMTDTVAAGYSPSTGYGPVRYVLGGGDTGALPMLQWLRDMPGRWVQVLLGLLSYILPLASLKRHRDRPVVFWRTEIFKSVYRKDPEVRDKLQLMDEEGIAAMRIERLPPGRYQATPGGKWYSYPKGAVKIYEGRLVKNNATGRMEPVPYDDGKEHYVIAHHFLYALGQVNNVPDSLEKREGDQIQYNFEQRDVALLGNKTTNVARRLSVNGKATMMWVIGHAANWIPAAFTGLDKETPLPTKEESENPLFNNPSTDSVDQLLFRTVAFAQSLAEEAVRSGSSTHIFANPRTPEQDEPILRASAKLGLRVLELKAQKESAPFIISGPGDVNRLAPRPSARLQATLRGMFKAYLVNTFAVLRARSPRSLPADSRVRIFFEREAEAGPVRVSVVGVENAKPIEDLLTTYADWGLLRYLDSMIRLEGTVSVSISFLPNGAPDLANFEIHTPLEQIGRWMDERSSLQPSREEAATNQMIYKHVEPLYWQQGQRTSQEEESRRIKAQHIADSYRQLGYEAGQNLEVVFQDEQGRLLVNEETGAEIYLIYVDGRLVMSAQLYPKTAQGDAAALNWIHGAMILSQTDVPTTEVVDVRRVVYQSQNYDGRTFGLKRTLIFARVAGGESGRALLRRAVEGRDPTQMMEPIPSLALRVLRAAARSLARVHGSAAPLKSSHPLFQEYMHSYLERAIWNAQSQGAPEADIRATYERLMARAAHGMIGLTHGDPRLRFFFLDLTSEAAKDEEARVLGYHFLSRTYQRNGRALGFGHIGADLAWLLIDTEKNLEGTGIRRGTPAFQSLEDDLLQTYIAARGLHVTLGELREDVHFFYAAYGPTTAHVD